jgi:hypothetical protein
MPTDPNVITTRTYVQSSPGMFSIVVDGDAVDPKTRDNAIRLSISYGFCDTLISETYYPLDGTILLSALRLVAASTIRSWLDSQQQAIEDFANTNEW